MTHRMYLTALIGCLSLALTVASNQSFGASGAAHGGAHGGMSGFHGFRFSHFSHVRHANRLRLGHANRLRLRFSLLRFNNRFSQFNNRFSRFNNQRDLGAVWPATGGYFYDSNAEPYPYMDVTGPTSGGINYTNPYDIPWDAVHRYPWGFANNSLQPVNVEPNVELSFGPACRSQSVTVPWSDGKDQTVNIVRC